MKNLLATSVGKIKLANPILTASGTYGSGKEYEDFVDIAKLGAVVTKSVTLKPTTGNPPPRVVETPSGMLNAIGLQNEGVDYFISELLPVLKKKSKTIVANVAGKSEADYIGVVEALNNSGVKALEINISCPNVKEGGMAFGVCGKSSAKLIKKLKKLTSLPLWVKMSPNVTDIADIARQLEGAGADALVVANTFLGMAINIETRKPIIANITGGLSGPAIHPMSLRCVWQVANAVKCPIIASGGARSVREVIAFHLAGASAVEIGMMNFTEPSITGRLIKELDKWCKDHNTSIKNLIGAMEQ